MQQLAWQIPIFVYIQLGLFMCIGTENNNSIPRVAVSYPEALPHLDHWKDKKPKIYFYYRAHFGKKVVRHLDILGV